MRTDEFQKQQDEHEEYESLLKQDPGYEKWCNQIKSGKTSTTTLTKEVTKRWT